MTNIQDKIIFGENGRSIATYYTINLEEVNEYIANGWRYEIDYKGKGFWLRAPDEWLVDLTDPFKIYYYGNPIVNLAYYKFLNNFVVRNQMNEYLNFIISTNKVFYKNFEVRVATGPVLQSEIRILASDKRVTNLKHDLFKSFIEHPLYEKYLMEAKIQLGDVRDIVFKYKDDKNFTDNEIEFYNTTDSYLKAIGEKVKLNHKILKDLRLQLPDCDIIILIPNGCYKYMTSVIDDSNIDKVMFWETHVNSHVNKTYTIYDRDFKGKRILLIDQVYSGKTLEIMKDLIIKRGGIPIVLGMFPKSSYSLKSVDYVTFLDRVIPVKDIEDSDDLMVKLYTKILKKENL